MKSIKNLEELKIAFKEWKPSDLAFIKKIELSLNSNISSENNIVIDFLCQVRNQEKGWPDLSAYFFEVQIRFENVRDFQANISGFGLQQVAGFDIIDISENGLEETNFLIEDYENGIIRFTCKEVIIISWKEPQLITFA